MKTKEIILYGIILGLVVNLIANQIFKFLPDVKHVDIIFTIVLIIICEQDWEALPVLLF